MDSLYLGLGSNLGDPAAQIRSAIVALSNLPDTEFICSSDFYRSPPLLKPGAPVDQPDFVNAVVALRTSLLPETLLDYCQSIEKAQGRVRGPAPWSARTLDIDILLYGQKIINTERLTIPHSGLVARNFVLYPLYQIVPELIVPGLGALSDLVKNCESGSLERVESI